jgi:hypothetical protein
VKTSGSVEVKRTWKICRIDEVKDVAQKGWKEARGLLFSCVISEAEREMFRSHTLRVYVCIEMPYSSFFTWCKGH